VDDDVVDRRTGMGPVVRLPEPKPAVVAGGQPGAAGAGHQEVALDLVDVGITGDADVEETAGVVDRDAGDVGDAGQPGEQCERQWALVRRGEDGGLTQP
jgi:hypothetical protein